MANLPVSGKEYFKDFDFDLVQYEIERDGQIIASLNGLPNAENGISYIHFPYGSDVQKGDVLINNHLKIIIESVDIDTYQGKSELLKAFFR
jgi:hypothetical protein